jgi:Putative peptidoglycan binding domain
MRKLSTILLCVAAFAAFAQTQPDLPFSDLPPTNEYGRCYAKCKIADQYETEQIQMVVRPATTKSVKVPARYETNSERIMTREGGMSYKTIPATYKTITEQVMIEAEKKTVRMIPARYRTESRQILVSEAHGEWVKKKKAPNCFSQNPDDCYIVCFEEVPAKYRTESYQVEAEPARSEEKVIPARYTTVSKRIIDEKAYTVEVPIEAQYRTVTRRVLVESETIRTEEIAATYRTVSQKRLVKQGGFTVWTEILCENRTTSDKVMDVQKALATAGYEVGTPDGRMGVKTQAALKQFQMDKNLPLGNLNIETLKALGVSEN